MRVEDEIETTEVTQKHVLLIKSHYHIYHRLTILRISLTCMLLLPHERLL